jgi:hypothetical protein
METMETTEAYAGLMIPEPWRYAGQPATYLRLVSPVGLRWEEAKHLPVTTVVSADGVRTPSRHLPDTPGAHDFHAEDPGEYWLCDQVTEDGTPLPGGAALKRWIALPVPDQVTVRCSDLPAPDVIARVIR